MNNAEQTSLLLEARPLPEPEATIWRILERSHRGRENAVRMPNLAALVGLSTRSLQSAIEYLIREHGKPIGSSCSEPYGYYVITDQADLEKTFRNRVNRGVANLAAAYKLKRAPAVLRALGQLDTLTGEA